MAGSSIGVIGFVVSADPDRRLSRVNRFFLGWHQLERGYQAGSTRIGKYGASTITFFTNSREEKHSNAMINLSTFSINLFELLLTSYSTPVLTAPLYIYSLGGRLGRLTSPVSVCCVELSDWPEL